MIESAIICLALNVYHESRGEPLRGQLAVALVTLNRAKRKPERICDVVFHPFQFSWANYEKLPPIKEKRAFQQAMWIAKTVWKIPDFTEGATHFHHEDLNPVWAAKLKKQEQIGRHIFYR